MIRRLGSFTVWLLRALLGLIVLVLVVIGVAFAVVETGWAKGAIRDLIVRQANNYLTATLSIGSLGGSLVRGIQLGDVNLARGDHTLIHVDEIALTYNVRELFQRGVVIRRVRLTKLVVAGAKMADGKWDLGALVKRDSREGERTGPSRPIAVQSIEVIDGRVMLHDPLDFGAAHVPTDFESINAAFAFAYVPVHWTLAFDRVSWVGHAPELSVSPLSGSFGRGPHGWFFEKMTVRTARSAFTLDGTVDNVATPTVLDLRVRADRFAFQEWAGVINGLKNIAVESSFDTSLKGPLTRLETNLQLTGTGGSVKGALALDTTVPGWRASGGVDVQKLDLARWLNRPDRPSDITGHVTFDLALELGRHFPRGLYAFTGPHAMYMDYAGDNVTARGQITADAVRVAAADAVAYGAHVTMTNGSIGVNEPFPYAFAGIITGIDLRRLPAAVPVPHVESLLTFDYDVTGRFSDPDIIGHATFADSRFLGAAIGPGTAGSIDTSSTPIHYTGDGEIDRVSLHHFGEGLDVAWMQSPVYAGELSGHFYVDGYGTDRASLKLTGGGRLSRASLFKGTLHDADVSIAIAEGSLTGSYDGAFEHLDPEVPFADARLAGELTGTGRVTTTVHDLLARDVTLADYDVRGSLSLKSSVLHDLAVDSADVDATLAGSQLTIARLDAAGAVVSGRASGSVALTDGGATDVQYDLSHVDLDRARGLIGLDASGLVTTKGRVTGTSAELRAVGNATVGNLSAFDVTALTLKGDYDITIPSLDLAQARGSVNAEGTFVTIAGQSFREMAGTAAYAAPRLQFGVVLKDTETRHGEISGEVRLYTDRRQIELVTLDVSIGRAPWHLVAHDPAPVVSWTGDSVAIAPLEFADGNSDERIGVSGTWRSDGAGALKVTATHVFLDTLQNAFERPTLYAGVLDMDATVSGTRDAPRVTADLKITSGRVQRISYQSLAGTIAYTGEMFDVDLRLDQAPGIWLTANGTMPLGLFREGRPEQPINLAIASSTINLGLLEGLTDVVREVTGTVTVNVKAIGTSRDPHVAGVVAMSGVGFLAAPSGVRYKNGRASIEFATDKVTVNALHIEDGNGKPLDVNGSLGTHELRIGDLEMQIAAKGFEVLRNELGRVNLDAKLELRGRYETPRIAGDITITNGSSLRVDELLQRTLFQPYAVEASALPDVDAVRALNPWDRLGLDLSLHVPDTLRLVGDNVQVSPGTPMGLGNINLRVAGDLYLYKDSGQPVSVTGSFDSVSGTYAFQGRPFDVDRNSSIDFRGDLNPELYVTVTRLINGVQTQVSVTGAMNQPELRLSSIPPLEQSDILSLIVFNTSTNDLSASQQQQLVVRAGALAAGFLATPILSSIEHEVGLDIFEIDPAGEFGTGPRVTVGQEIAPGLVARFSRQFGTDEYDEAQIEYSLSRILKIRATYSDAQTTTGLAAFRRVERSGVDLLFYFTF